MREAEPLRVLERENPVPGEDVQLHMDLRLQRLAHDLLDGRRGAIIAIEPSTGGILALASVPGFDANLFRPPGIGVEAYRSLSSSVDKPLFNRAPAGPIPARLNSQTYARYRRARQQCRYPGTRPSGILATIS